MGAMEIVLLFLLLSTNIIINKVINIITKYHHYAHVILLLHI